MNSTKSQDELIRDLPPEISNLLFNTDLDFYLINLLGNYSIDDNAKMLVVLATRALLVGDIAPTEFVKLVCDVTGLDQAKASLIAQDINRDIFNPVKDALKLVHASNAAQPPVAAIPTPYQSPATQPAPTQTTMPVPPVQSMPRPAATVPVPPPAMPMPTPSASVPPRMPTPMSPQSPVMPVPQAPAPVAANNLEAKLGGAFTIKKDVMFTQQGAPTPLTPIPSAPSAPAAIPVPPALGISAPAIPKPPQVSDPYRELPS